MKVLSGFKAVLDSHSIRISFRGADQGDSDTLLGGRGNDKLQDVLSVTVFDSLSGGDDNDLLNCFDGNYLSSWDAAYGGLGTDTFWCDECGADTQLPPGDDMPGFAPPEIWYVQATTLYPPNSVTKPVEP